MTLACLGITGGLASGALAVAARPAAWVLLNADVPVVQDGVLLFRFDPGDLIFPGDTPVLAPLVTDDMGTPIPGTVEMLELETARPYGIYRFDSALVAEHRYVAGGDLIFGASFQATGAFMGTPPAPTVSAMEGIHLLTETQRCCTGTTLQSPFGPTAPACLVLVANEQAAIRVGAVAENDSSSRQYLYRATLTAPETRAGDWLPASEASLGWSFVTPMLVDEYCYRVDAYRLTDGVEVAVAEGCVPAPASTFRKVGPGEQEIATALNVQGCLMPPADMTAAWCEVNRVACMDDASALSLACDQASYETTCSAFPPSDMSLVDLIEGTGAAGAPAAGAGGTGAANGAGGSGGGAGASPPSDGDAATAGTSGDADASAEQMPATSDHKSSGGCSISAAARGGTVGRVFGLVLLVTVISAARRARRRWRATVCPAASRSR